MTALAGSRWRLLVHDKPHRRGGMYGKSHSVTSHGNAVAGNPLGETVVIPDAIFDEVVVDRWLHVEQMDARQWWMRVGPVTINLHVAANGRADRVLIEIDHDPTCPVEHPRWTT